MKRYLTNAEELQLKWLLSLVFVFLEYNLINREDVAQLSHSS